MYVDLPDNKPDSNNSDWDELPSNEMLLWGEALDRLLPQRQIGSKENPKEKFSGMVQFWREWNPQLGHGVWNKVYRNGHKLQAFNQWEVEFLAQLALHSVGQTYHPVSLLREGTASDPRLLGGTRPAQYLIQTRDAGPTLADWLRMPVRSGNQLTPVAHCLVSPENFLLMAQSLLRALENIHAMNFVHCDLHAGNISIPAKVMLPPVDGKNADSALSFQLNLPELTLIDFGFSINCRKTPYTTLPFAQDGYRARISPHLKRVLVTIEEQTTKQLPKEKHWDEVWLDANFWQSWIGASPLDLIKTIDWREDLYQLGHLLADIRDGTGPDAMHLGGRILCKSRQAEVNTLIDELPEQLMRWGENVGTATPPRPHREYLNRIDAVLTQARHNGDTAITTFTLNIKDYDSIQSQPKQPETAAIPVRQRAAPETQIRFTGTNSLQQENQQSFCDFQDVAEPWCPVVVAIPAHAAEHANSWNSIKGIAVSKDPITVEQFSAFIQNSGNFKSCWKDAVQKLKNPMVNVTRGDCEAWLDWFNRQLLISFQGRHALPEYRLLTEDEWRYCCACGTNADYFIGQKQRSNIRKGDAIYKFSEANIAHERWPDRDNKVEALHINHEWNSINAFNLRGMHGNVWEVVTSNNGASTFIRGGSYASSPKELAANNVKSIDQNHCGSDIGFRICRNLYPNELKN